MAYAIAAPSTTATSIPQAVSAYALRLAHSQKTSELLVGKVVPFVGVNRVGYVNEYKDGELTGNKIQYEKFTVQQDNTNKLVTLVYFMDQDPALVQYCDDIDSDDRVYLIVYPTTSKGRFKGNRKVMALSSQESVATAKNGMVASRSRLSRLVTSVDPDAANEALAKALTDSTSHSWKHFTNQATAYLPV
jgi:hypothetical protein